MAEPIAPNSGLGLRSSNTLGWETPELDQMNSFVAEKHMQESAPMVGAVMKAASPTATPQDRLKAASAFQSSNETRIGDVLGAIANFNPRDLYIALTGGSDVKERGYDGSSNPYAVVYNQRGELRGYEDPATGRRLTEDELAAIGPITSKRDVTAERQAAFKAAGASLAEVAAARNQAFIKTQNIAKEAGRNGGLIADLGAQNDEITQRLGPATLGPKQLAFIRGISNIGVGDTSAIRQVNEKLDRASVGRLTNDEWRKTADVLGGIALGLQYREGEGLTDSSGVKVNRDKLEQLQNSFEKSQSSNKNVQARQADMLARAQTLAAGDENLLRDITTLINNNAKISLSQNAIEQAGGIGVAKPNLPHELGESFYSANLKAKSDRMYGELAALHSQFMLAKAGTLRPGQSPDIGRWEVEFSNLPQVREIRKATKQAADSYIESVKPDIERINKQTVPVELTNQSMVANPNMTMPAATPPSSSSNLPGAAPRPKEPAKAEQKVKRTLDEILGVKR